MPTPTIDPKERFSLLDAIRGFAVFGIFGINMVASSFNWGNHRPLYFDLGEADELFKWIMEALVEGKFYSIFSLLFGIGFGLQLERHSSSGMDGLPLFKRRLWGLLFIGFMHMLLIWMGDILFLYAWLGFVLIAFRNKSDRWLLRASLWCLFMPVLLFPLRLINANLHLGIFFYALFPPVSGVLGVDIQHFDPEQMFGQPGWGKYFRMNLFAILFRQADLFDQARPFKVFAMFLLGLWVSRHQWYKNPGAFLTLGKKYVLMVFPVALLINLGMAKISWDHYYAGQWMGLLKTFLYFLGVVPLPLCYVYLFCRAYLSGKYPALHGFTYIGRMALTNYLAHSLLYMVLFRGPFLGLAGNVGILALMVPVLVYFSLQVVFSKWWLQRYYFGPAEWLWRSMTYGNWQPMLRESPAT